MIDEAELEARVRRTFEAVAATTRVGTAPRSHDRRHKMVRVAALVAVVAAVVLLLLAVGRNSPVRVRTDTPATSDDTPRTAPVPHSITGMVAVASEDGHFVGYVRQSYIHMPMPEYWKTVNARTMWPVTDDHGTVVGYIAPDVPFVSLARTQQPGFDIEKVRAARNGGCEDQVGDPTFKQEFPPCSGGSKG